MQRLKYYNVGTSWSGFESMATMTFDSSIHDVLFVDLGTVRIHICFECMDELMEDIDSSLNKMK